jgi:hypothetical protein
LQPLILLALLSLFQSTIGAISFRPRSLFLRIWQSI